MRQDCILEPAAKRCRAGPLPVFLQDLPERHNLCVDEAIEVVYIVSALFQFLLVFQEAPLPFGRRRVPRCGTSGQK